MSQAASRGMQKVTCCNKYSGRGFRAGEQANVLLSAKTSLHSNRHRLSLQRHGQGDGRRRPASKHALLFNDLCWMFEDEDVIDHFFVFRLRSGRPLAFKRWTGCSLSSWLFSRRCHFFFFFFFYHDQSCFILRQERAHIARMKTLHPNPPLIQYKQGGNKQTLFICIYLLSLFFKRGSL